MASVVGIDQGTTGTKVVLLDEGGELTLAGSRKHRQIYPRSGWVEHDPEELLANVELGLKEAADQCESSLAGIGIDNQGETIVAWDSKTGEPICNAIVWQDNRTQQRIAELKSDGVEREVLNRAGLPLDPYFSASKMSWILDHVPAASELLKQNRLRIATSDAFFLDRMTGVYATDSGTASRTSLFNLEQCKWDDELCRIFGVPREILPEVKRTVGDFGVYPPLNCSVTANIVDQQAALYGHGCIEVGDTKVTFGTGAFALTNTGPQIFRRPEQGFLPTVAWELESGQLSYAVDAGLYNAGSAVEWLLELSLADSVQNLNRFGRDSVAADGLFFVPALSGLGCPYWERSASALWIGMDQHTSRSDLCQAVIEGVAFRSSQLIDSLAKEFPLPSAIPADGGLSNNPFFCQFFANLIQREVVVPSTAEITAFGTAKLAMMGAGSAACEVKSTEGGYSARYFPKKRLDAEKAKFAEAVDRCRNWRQSE